jgi:hypothetical protein
LVERVPIGDQALGHEVKARLDDVAFAQAEVAGDGGVGPEAEPGPVRGQVQEEEQRDLFERQLPQPVAQAMIDPGKVARERAHTRGVDGVT